jgi:hypothetical protein
MHLGRRRKREDHPSLAVLYKSAERTAVMFSFFRALSILLYLFVYTPLSRGSPPEFLLEPSIPTTPEFFKWSRRSAPSSRSSGREMASRVGRGTTNFTVPFHGRSPESARLRSPLSSIGLSEHLIAIRVSTRILWTDHCIIGASIARD